MPAESMVKLQQRVRGQLARLREGAEAEAALKTLFKFSTLWLFIVFALILVERALGLPLFAPVLG